VQTLAWNQLTDWHQYDWIVFGTKSPEFLVSRKDLPSTCTSHKLVMDLCVPRNVEPALGRDSRVTLLNIDQINRMLKIRRQRLTHVLSDAEQMICNASRKQIYLFSEKEKAKMRCIA
jgi:glutamyl-tRNA reductase